MLTVKYFDGIIKTFRSVAHPLIKKEGTHGNQKR